MSEENKQGDSEVVFAEVVELEVKEDIEESVTLKFSPALIDPKKEELQALAQRIQEIEVDPSKMNKEVLELINTSKNELVKARTSIEKDGLAARRPANDFVKKVKAYQDELIEIIKPEEERMKGLEKAAKEFAMREERMKTLPEYKERLASIGDTVEISDDELLALDPNERDVYYNGRLSAKLEADRATKEEADRKAAEEQAEKDRAAKEAADKLAAEQRALEMEKQNMRFQKIIALGFKQIGVSFVYEDLKLSQLEISEMNQEDFDKLLGEMAIQVDLKYQEKQKEAEELKQKEIADAAAKAKAEAEAEAERKENERLAEESRKQKEAEEAKQIEEKAKAEAEAKADYQNWLKENNYNEETDIVVDQKLYRKVSEYTPKED